MITVMDSCFPSFPQKIPSILVSQLWQLLDLSFFVTVEVSEGSRRGAKGPALDWGYAFIIIVRKSGGQGNRTMTGARCQIAEVAEKSRGEDQVQPNLLVLKGALVY